MVMQILDKHKLYAKLPKRSFAHSEVMFLEQMVGQKGLHVDPGGC